MTGLPGRGGLPATKVIPPQWSAHHRPTAEGQLTAQCEVRSPEAAGATFNEALGYTTSSTSDPIYIGPCRVQRLQPALSASERETAGRETVIRECMVVLPHDAVAGRGASVGDLITITECPDDATLTGRVLRVRDVRQGSLIWQRDLTCEDISPTSR